MTTTTLARTPLTTDAELCKFVQLLLGEPHRTQMWWILLDAEDRTLDPLIPIECGRLDKVVVVPGIGRRVMADQLAETIAGAIADTPVERVVILWERRGSATPSRFDREQARLAAEACERAGIVIRAQLLLHNDGADALAAPR